MATANPESASGAPGPLGDVRARVERTMTEDDVPGLAVAVVRGDRVVWAEGFGVTDRASGRPVSANTPFSVQSVSKTYTAVAFLIAATRGLVALDDPVRAVLPEFRVRSRWGDDGSQITFRHLLAHRSGLPSEAPCGNNYDARTCTFAEHVASLEGVWLKHPVGDRLAYSNVGYDLVARALERLYGLSFPDLMQRLLLAPLGMADSTFAPEALLRSGLYAKGHRGPWETDNHRPATLGGGGLFTTARDAARFLSFLLRGCAIDGAALVRPDLLEEMARVPCPAPGQTEGQALGLVTETFEGARVCRHYGGGSGYFSVHAWAPERDVGVAVFLNQVNCPPIHIELYREIFAALQRERGALADAPPACRVARPTACVSRGEVAPWVGTYRRGDATRDVAERDGTLTLDRQPLRAVGPAEYAAEDGTTISFRLSESGDRELEIRGLSDPERWPFDHGLGEPRDPDRPEWQAWLGVYGIFDEGLWYYASVCVRDGHLHVIGQNGDARLREAAPALFFTADGDTVTFRDDAFVWAGAQVHARVRDPDGQARRLAALDPGDRRVTLGSLMRLRDACRALGDPRAADAVLKVNLSLRPPVPTLVRMADAHQSDDPEEARRLCRMALSIEPASPEALESLARLERA